MLTFLIKYATVTRKDILNVSQTFFFLHYLIWSLYVALNFKNQVTYLLNLHTLHMFVLTWEKCPWRSTEERWLLFEWRDIKSDQMALALSFPGMPVLGQGNDGLVHRVLAIATCRSEFDPENPRQNAGSVVMLVIPALGRHKHVNPWGSLASQPSWISKPRVTERPLFQKTNVDDT